MRRVINYLTSNKLVLVQVLFFLFFSLSLIVTNGLNNCWWGSCGLHIGQWHMHDALWHISLAEIGFESFPLSHPFLSGSSLNGYNYLIDAVIYAFVSLGLNPFFVFFRLLPTMVAIYFVYSVIQFALYQSHDRVYQKFLIFFFLFGNSASYLASLYTTGTIEYATLRGFPVVTSIQPTMMFLNIQFALSLALMLDAIRLLGSKARYRLILLFLLAFTIMGLKFYGGAVLALVTTLQLIGSHGKSIREWLAVVFGTLFSSLVFYYQPGLSSQPFVFAFMAIPHVMIESTMLFYNHSLVLARYYLYENGGWQSPRLIAIELYTILLFAIVNLGTRLVGIFSVSRNYLISIVVVITFLIPIFLIQDGGWYNTMQFLYYGSFFSGILAAHTLTWLYSRNHLLGRGLVILIIIATIPNLLEQLRFLTSPQNVIPESELAVLKTLKSMPDGVIYISNPELKNAIVPSLSGKTAYYLDVDQLMVTKANYIDRQKEIKENIGAKVINIPADYYYIYKSDEGSHEAIKALSADPAIFKVSDLPELTVFRR